MLGGLINMVLKIKPCNFPLSNTIELLNNSDAVFANLSCVLSDSNTSAGDYEPFFSKTDRKNSEVLKKANITAVSLANPEVLNFGVIGLKDTLAELDRSKIHYAGVGGTLLEACQPVSLNINKCRIGFLACTNLKSATISEYQPCYIDLNSDNQSIENFFIHVREIRKDYDILILSVHWVSRLDFAIPFFQADFAHKAIDAGIDIVIGHYQHIPKGVEKYNNGVIIYSTGDFITDSRLVSNNEQLSSFIYLTEIIDGKIKKLSLVPIIIKNLQTSIATGDHAVKIMKELEEESLVLGTQFSWSEEPEYYLELNF